MVTATQRRLAAISAALSMAGCGQLPAAPMPQDDPCGGIAGCDTQVFGGDRVAAAPVPGGYRATILAADGTTRVVDFTVSAGSTVVTYHDADGAVLGSATLDSAPADARGAGLGAYVLYANQADAAVSTASLSTEGYTGTNPTGTGFANHAGCDPRGLLGGLDCTAKGGCCDAHDECITANCRSAGDSGNVFTGLFVKAFTTSLACKACHVEVMGCLIAALPGPGHCCAANNCGELQQCMIDGVVITDAAVCAQAGLACADPSGALQAGDDADHLINNELWAPQLTEDAAGEQRIQDDLDAMRACLPDCEAIYEDAHEQALAAYAAQQANDLDAENAAIARGDQDIDDGRNCLNAPGGP
jgi:hypothetical protein